MNRLSATELRQGFLRFFEERGHAVVPSASLIPHDPDLLFTVAGMVPFKPYFLGEEKAPYRRATTIQKCVRAGGKDSDLEEVGKDGSHLSFFEMLGNFSFGDYFKAEAIPMAWDMVTDLFGIDPELLWVTVHLSDDEAAAIWLDGVGLRPDRLQRLGADNWWGPPGGPPGPCGPSSEIFVDKGPGYGPGGGPAHGADARYLEIWNLVFMQFSRDVDGVDTELPAKNIDTGAGLERILGVLQGVDTVYETDVLAPIVETAEEITGTRVGAGQQSDVSLRILAEHARTISFLISDGVNPTNEDRGYVLRRIIRRAVRHGFLLGVETLVTPALVDRTIEVMGEAYPDLVKNHSRIRDVAGHEEEHFRRTLATGLGILDGELGRLRSGRPLSGVVAFTLHDTHGFPLELTQEIAEERGFDVDIEEFAAEMAAQRERAKQDFAGRRAGETGIARIELADGGVLEAEGEGVGVSSLWPAMKERLGETEFVGREDFESKAVVLATTTDSIFLDRSPFYAESGGQVGDTGLITSDTGTARVVETVPVLPGLHRHLVEVVEGEIKPGQEVVAAIDVPRRDAIRRNHTGTHILHWALREVLGDHVKQEGSLVAPDRLRFDFFHFEPMTAAEIARVEDLVNAEVLTNAPVRHYETTRAHADEMGAVAFFGDKYGDVVHVLEAGPQSIELCGGTHVRALGDIGLVKIVSEGSIGSNIRRLEALTGTAPLERMRAEEMRLARAADALGVPVDEVVEGAQRRSAEVKELRKEVEQLRRQAARGRADDLASQVVDGVVLARIDGLPRGDLRDLAVAVRDQPGVRAVVLGGEAEGGGAALVAATTPDSGLDAGVLLDDAKTLIKGGGRPNAELTMLGGKDAGGVDPALEAIRSVLGLSST